jgi:hypothetical protein
MKPVMRLTAAVWSCTMVAIKKRCEGCQSLKFIKIIKKPVHYVMSGFESSKLKKMIKTLPGEFQGENQGET